MNQIEPFNSLLGKTIVSIDGLSVGSSDVFFKCSDGSEYALTHQQDCCEAVNIEDVCGDIRDIIGGVILQAEEATSSDNPPGVKTEEYQDSFTWTFYRLTTNLGQVVIRWYGESNGYYSESVDFLQTKDVIAPPEPTPTPTPEKQVDPVLYHNYLNNLFKQ